MIRRTLGVIGAAGLLATAIARARFRPRDR